MCPTFADVLQIHCLHSTQYGELLSPVVSKVRGRYMLIDEG